MRPPKVVELRLKSRAVAAPAMDEEQLRLARASVLVVQPHARQLRVRHDAPIVSRPRPLTNTLGWAVFRNVP
jgi:hypothetical protein